MSAVVQRVQGGLSKIIGTVAGRALYGREVEEILGARFALWAGVRLEIQDGSLAAFSALGRRCRDVLYALLRDGNLYRADHPIAA